MNTKLGCVCDGVFLFFWWLARSTTFGVPTWAVRLLSTGGILCASRTWSTWARRSSMVAVYMVCVACIGCVCVCVCFFLLYSCNRVCEMCVILVYVWPM